MKDEKVTENQKPNDELSTADLEKVVGGSSHGSPEQHTSDDFRYAENHHRKYPRVISAECEKSAK